MNLPERRTIGSAYTTIDPHYREKIQSNTSPALYISGRIGNLQPWSKKQQDSAINIRKLIYL
jgi:hypothetical protein